MPTKKRAPEWKEEEKEARPQEKWNDEVEEDLKIMGIRNLHTVARDEKE